MIGPVFHRQNFQPAVGVGDILIELPDHRAGAATDVAHLGHDGQKGLLLGGVDAVVLGFQHAAARGVEHGAEFGRDGLGGRYAGPGGGRGEGRLGLVDVEAADQQAERHFSAAGRQQRGGQADARAQPSPDEHPANQPAIRSQPGRRPVPASAPRAAPGAGRRPG